MTYEEALNTLQYEVDEEGHCGYIEEEIHKAIEALEKQIPKKPKKETVQVNGYDHGCDDYCYTEELCPSCNLPILRMSYCHHCGQALDWRKK